MSSNLRLTQDHLSHLAGFLSAITEATRKHQVTLCPYGPAQLQIDETTISFQWDESAGYVLADRVGD